MEFRIVSLNVNSIVGRGRRFLLDDFVRGQVAAVYLLQETKFGPNFSLSLPSYSVYFSNNRVGCGGVAICVRAGLHVRNVRRITGGIDAVFLDVRIGNVWISVGSTYIHPGCGDLGALISLVGALDHFVFGGDLNARHPGFGDLSANGVGARLVSWAEDDGLLILSPPTPTCYRLPEGSYIDKFCLSPSFPFSHSDVSVLPSFSDHSGISITIHSANSADFSGRAVTRKIFEFTNVGGMNRYLEAELARINVPENVNLVEDDLEHVATRLSELLANTVEHFVPKAKVRTDGIVLSGHTKALIRAHRAATRKLHRNRIRGAWLPTLAGIRTEVSLLRQMMTEALRADVSNHYGNIMANTVTLGDAHCTVRKCTRLRAGRGVPGSIYADEDKALLLNGQEAIADGFRTQFRANHELSPNMTSDMDDMVTAFSNRAPHATNCIPFSNDSPAGISEARHRDELDRNRPVEHRGLLTSTEEVAGIIGAVRPKKSAGPDGMPYFLFKFFSPPIVLFLTILFNQLISRSYFPRIWRHSIVSPIPKPGKDGSVATNWRPISNLDCVSKIFERVLAVRLRSAMDVLCPLPDQYGFQRSHSAVHALGRLQDAINRGLDAGRFTTFVSLDLRAAFDTVWHDALIFKMGELGFSAFLVSVFRSFLSDRTFSVRVGETISVSSPMRSGTPQGSVCSPLLFNIYLHDLPRDDFVRTLQYADDTSLYCVSDNPARVQSCLNLHLRRLSGYFARWRMVLSERKSALLIVMGFARETGTKLRRMFQGMVIAINGHVLVPQTRTRFLGVILSRNNRFVAHVDHALGRARRAYFAIRSLLRSRLIDPRVRVDMYRVYVRPILAYAAPVWVRTECLSSHQMERMRRFERTALRAAAGFHRARGTYRYAGNDVLHEVTGCERIDRFLVRGAIRFFQSCAASGIEKIRSLISTDDGRLFPSLAHIWHQSRGGGVMTNGRLLMFHRAYDGSGRLVYGTNQ